MTTSVDQPSGSSTAAPSGGGGVHGKLYAFLIAFISAVGGFLFGYDLAIIGGANVFLKEQFHLSDKMFGFTSASAGLGCMIGPLLGARLCDRLGRRNTLLAACFLLAYGFMGLMTLAACFLVDRAGRRPLWLVSSLVMVAANVLMGLVFHLQITGPLVLAAVFLCAIPHSFALGSLPWLMMSEIFPTRIRARAVAITTTFIWAVCFLAQYLFPVIAGLSKRIIGSIGGAFWFSAAICVLAFLFGLWLLPETKGRTLEQIAESWKTGRRA